MVAGRIVACLEVRQACRRHLGDLKRSKRRDYRWKFDEAKANRFCRFAEAFPHVKNDFHGNAARRELIRLEPWQIFIGCSIFGWVDKAKGFRRFSEAYVEVPRKNGKTTLAALIALYCFAAEGESGAEVFIAATSRDQAGDIFRTVKLLAESSSDFRDAFGVWVNSFSLVIQSLAAALKILKGNPADGPSPYCTISDEFHEHPTDRIAEWHRTGAQARQQALLLQVTTSGSDTSSPCYNRHLDVQDVLSGRRFDDRLFCIIFTVDKEIDWTSKQAIVMANPNYGVSVNPETIEAHHFQAQQSAMQQNAFKTKNLDIWVDQKVAWINMVKWNACADPMLKIEDFLEDDCKEAVDLASKTDTVSIVRMFRREIDGEQHYYCFSRHYLNAERVRDKRNTHFLEWASKGYLIETPGNVTDYLQVCDDLVDDANQVMLRELVFDPFHAGPLIQILQAREDWVQGVEIAELKQCEENTSNAMKEFEAVVLSGRFHFDGNPLLTWMVGNTICRVSQREYWYPVRENVERKIDGAVAIIFAMNRWMASESTYFKPFVI